MGDTNRSRGEFLHRLLDSSEVSPVETGGALTVLEGCIGGSQIRVGVTDRSIRGGSFGVDECDTLTRHLARSVNDAMPVLLVLDSAGARMDAGLAGLAAFRRMYRVALDVRSSGVATGALMLRNCFGGASMLAMLCNKRSALRSTRIGMSGPAIVEAMSGGADLVSADRDAVDGLYGAPARADSGALDNLFDENEPVSEIVRAAIEGGTGGKTSILEQHDRLRERLLRAGVDLSADQTVQLGAAFNRGQPVGARDIWLLADGVLSQSAGREIVLVVNCPGQAATREDESLVLSEYVAHLGVCLHLHGVKGGRVTVHLDGESAGGIYVALAAGADAFNATADSIVRVLPALAIESILRKSVSDQPLREAVETGVVDNIVPINETGNARGVATSAGAGNAR